MHDESRPPSPLLARALKRVGQLADQGTRAGRLFARAESSLTKATESLNQSPAWLKFNGELLQKRGDLRVRRRSLTEGALRALRLPTSSEVGALHEQIRHLEEQVGVLGSQLEMAIELLERKGATPAASTNGPSGSNGSSGSTEASGRPQRPRA